MATYNYAEQFERELQQKYSRELTSHALINLTPGLDWVNAWEVNSLEYFCCNSLSNCSA